jgi:glucose/arabinose dehydrogenase/sugar lactone lactonase YvrE/mono/diheme cytochrome c family protein
MMRSKSFRIALVPVLLALPFLLLHAADPSSIDLPGDRAFPESITSTSDGTIYVGNIAEGGILRITGSKVEAWIAPGAFGSHRIYGVFADEKSGTLWACSNDLGGHDGSALKGFDLKTGEGKVSYAFPPGRAECNDIAIGKDGAVYVSDTGAPRVLRLAPGSQTLEVWVTDPRFDQRGNDTDGIAFGGDGQLYVNTLGDSHLYRIPLEGDKPGTVSMLQTSRPIVATDGMRHEKDNQFLMVEGVGRLDRVVIDGDNATVTTLREGLDEPTSVAVVGQTAWVSEGQLSYLFDRAKRGQQPNLPFHLQAVSLGPGSGAASSPAPAATMTATPAVSPDAGCNGEKVGITLPPGFCATIFADGVGHARHMSFASDGTLYVNTWSGVYYPHDKSREGGFLVALRDTKGTGHADVNERFGPGVAQGSPGGTGIALHKGWLYFEMGDKIARYKMTPGQMIPQSDPEVIVSGLPLAGEHPMHQFIIDDKDNLFINVGAFSNACEHKLGEPLSPGYDPCTELETRAGVWRYSATKLGQTFSPTERYVTGMRNGGGMQLDKSGRLLMTQHGRDRLSQSFKNIYTPEQGPELPAEELLVIKQGADYGWPYCYYDGFQQKLVLAPEYGGDGKTVGRCADKVTPIAFYPAHWAPNDLLLYYGTSFPSPYRGGAFIAFHGSWNRSPAPQAGFRVVFQPIKKGNPSGAFITFADGFPGKARPDNTAYRPSGLVMGPDGALYVSEDYHSGRIWKIVYNGPKNDSTLTPAPDPVYAASASGATGGRDVSMLPLAPGTTREQVALGARIFQGEARNGTCGGCHGINGTGASFGSDLSHGVWLWSDGSLAGITSSIKTGVSQPKQHAGAMPPSGGTDLSSDDLAAVSAYVWAIGHQQTR